MLKWSTGAKPGKAPKRPARTSDQVAEAKKKYEDKRVRVFKGHWSEGRPWLKYEENMMYCTYCKEQGKEGKFVTGCTNFRIDTIQAHEESAPHINAKAVATRPPQEKSEAGKTIQTLKKCEFDRLNILFRNAHAVAKHHMSFKTYNIICKLDKAKGLDIGESYLNDKKACEFIKNIAEVSRNDIKDRLEKALFLSITCDGSSDFMGDEYESLWIRSAQNGKIFEKFFDLGTAESAGSQDIFDYIKATCEDRSTKLWSKVIGFCSDGASNMLGIRNGVAALMRREHPEIVVTHCLAHRVELSFKDAIKSSKLYDKAITLLLGLYYLYRRGPKQKKALKRAFKALDMKRILPTRVGGTRWMPHMLRAINVLIKGYRGFKAHLESASHDNPKAEGYARILTDVAVITFILNLKMTDIGKKCLISLPPVHFDTLEILRQQCLTHQSSTEILLPLNRLSLILQKPNLTLYNGHAQIKATTEVLKKMKVKTNEEITAVASEKTYQGETLKGHVNEQMAYRVNLLDKLVIALDKRFPSTEIVEASAILDFKLWPNKENHEAVLEYGDHEIHLVKKNLKSTLMRSGMDIDEVDTEWAIFKSLIYQRYSTNLKDDHFSWGTLFDQFNDGLDNIKLAVDALLSLPATSVNNETTFSRTKLCKGKRRGHLKTETLKDLIQVQIETSNIEEYNPKPAIDNWMITPSGRRRRVGYTKKGRDTQDDTVVNDDVQMVVIEHPEDQESEVISDENEVAATSADPVIVAADDDDVQMVVIEHTGTPDSDVSTDDESDPESEDENEENEIEEHELLKNLKKIMSNYEE